jgi:hypothetical protein
MSTKSLLAVAAAVAVLGLATYKFDVVARLTGGGAAPEVQGGQTGLKLAVQPPPPAPSRPTSPVAAPAAPPVQQAFVANVAVLPGREPANSDQPARKELPPQIVLSEVLGPNNSYRDDVFGISATFPEGWVARHAARWGDGNRQNTVSLDPGLPFTPSMYYKRYQPAEAERRHTSAEAYFREEAAKKEASRLPGSPDYRNVPESFEFGEINGAPAMSYFATFTQGDKIMTEYFVRVAGQQSYVMFFTTGELESVRPAMPKIQQMAKSVRIP